MKEDVIHFAIVAALRYRHPDLVIVHVPNEHMGLLTQQQKARWHKMGFVKGFVDLMIIDGRGRVMFLEVKTGKGRLTEEEATFLDEMRERGFCVDVCYGVDEGISLVENWVNA